MKKICSSSLKNNKVNIENLPLFSVFNEIFSYEIKKDERINYEKKNEQKKS